MSESKGFFIFSILGWRQWRFLCRLLVNGLGAKMDKEICLCKDARPEMRVGRTKREKLGEVITQRRVSNRVVGLQTCGTSKHGAKRNEVEWMNQHFDSC